MFVKSDYLPVCHDEVRDGKADERSAEPDGSVKKKFLQTALGVITAEISSESRAEAAPPVLQQDGNRQQYRDYDLGNR